MSRLFLMTALALFGTHSFIQSAQGSRNALYAAQASAPAASEENQAPREGDKKDKDDKPPPDPPPPIEPPITPPLLALWAADYGRVQSAAQRNPA